QYLRIAAPLTLLCGLLVTGCGSGGGPVPSSPTANTRSGEPTAGRWATIVLPSGSSIPVAPPPVSGSAQAAQELTELHARQSRRTSATLTTIAFWQSGAAVQWNAIARQLVIGHNTSPPQASRVYALLSVAQYDALVTAWNNKYVYLRPAPSAVDSTLAPAVPPSADPVYPSEHAVVSGTSAAILESLYPDATSSLEASAQQDEQSRLDAGVNYASDITAGDGLGRSVAQQELVRAASDGSSTPWTGTVPTGTGLWVGTKPLLPTWAGVKPWLMTSDSEFRPAPPPAYGSPEYAAALNEVRQIALTRTAEQTQIAIFWADGAGTATPPGHWNQIASDFIVKYGLNEIRSARALALINMAMLDAGICCWDAKFTYWFIRPSQADPSINLAVPLPNFPSYTSGHASFSGAASTVLGYLFPAESPSVTAMAQQAMISRIYGGIHYRFDGTAGLQGGQMTGALAVQRGMRDGSP
nr:phosphatase PAP2 family protein [Armatimonadota bacterium]